MSMLGEPNYPPRRPRWLEHLYDVVIGAAAIATVGIASTLIVTGIHAAGANAIKVAAVFITMSLVIAGCGLVGKMLRS